MIHVEIERKNNRKKCTTKKSSNIFSKWWKDTADRVVHMALSTHTASALFVERHIYLSECSPSKLEVYIYNLFINNGSLSARLNGSGNEVFVCQLGSKKNTTCNRMEMECRERERKKTKRIENKTTCQSWLFSFQFPCLNILSFLSNDDVDGHIPTAHTSDNQIKTENGKTKEMMWKIFSLYVYTYNVRYVRRTYRYFSFSDWCFSLTEFN